MNLPEEFENRMKKMLSDEYEEFKASYDDDKKTGLRVNELKIDKARFKEIAPFSLEEVGWCKTGFVDVNSEDRPGRHALHDAGACYMQEPSAMAVADAVSVEKGMKVLDLCAAPGGKSTQIASALKGTGILVSNEINAGRSKILSQNIERMGVRNCVVLNESPDRLSGLFEEYFDVVFVDAPCSGEGMFRKDETAVNEWSEDNVAMCAKRQCEILDEAVKMVGNGGILCYSTCTFAPDEDENQVVSLLLAHPEFTIISPKNCEFFDGGHTEWVSVECSDEIKEKVKKAMRLWPHKIAGEGHFAAVFKKEGEKDGENEKSRKKSKNRADTSSLKEFIKENLVDFDLKSEDIIQVDDRLYLKPDGFDVDVSKLHVVRMGLLLGTVKKDRFEPAHSLAMALKPAEVKRYVDLSDEEAFGYRHGEEIRKDIQNGWTLVCVNGVSLGWGKVNSGVIKNHYPKGLRINY